MHKRKVAEGRRSYSFTHKSHKKDRSYSIDQVQKKEPEALPRALTHSNTKLSQEVKAARMVSEFERVAEQYIHFIDKGDLGRGFDQLAVLLNYAVDLGSRALFFIILHTMCQFHETLEDYKMALKMYLQYREAALLQKDYQNLGISFIGVARCAAQSKLLKEAVVILKKGLDYAWFANDAELELSLYDELGEKYYRMGEIDKASTYHAKYADAITEPTESPLRVLSRQQVEFLHRTNLAHDYESLSPLFIAHLSLPLKSIGNLPALFPEQFTAREQLHHNNIFDQDPHEIEYQIRRLLRGWMFSSETEEPSLENVKEFESKKQLYNSKKYAYIDFKMNRHFRAKGIKVNPRATFQAEE